VTPLVIHLLPVDAARGAQSYASELRDAMNDASVQHRTLTLFRSRGGTLHPDSELDAPNGRLRALGFDPRAVFRLRRWLRDARPAVVVAHGGEPLKYAVLAGVPRSRLVYLKIGVADAQLVGVRRRFHTLMLGRPRAVVVVSRAAAREAAALGVDKGRIRLIVNGRDPARYRLAHLNAVPRLVFVGQLNPSKRPLRFVELVQALREHGCALQASIAGDGPLLETVRNAGADIEVLGTVTDVPTLLADSDVLVFTGEPPEGMPGVLIEAGMSGLPVVTTAVPGAEEVVEHAETGLVVPVDDFDALVTSTMMLIVDGDKRRRMGRAARHRCEERFSLASGLTEWKQLFAEIIAECTSST